jgi:1-acyl-sn-glycerol-3-phosphate acyltransferase
MVDPMYILPTTKEGVHFIAKKEAEKIPVLGFFIRRVKAILVNRDGSDARAIMDGLRCLKHGDKLAIYPEGKRNKTDEPFLPFKSGSALFAIRAKVPIIPVVIYQKALNSSIRACEISAIIVKQRKALSDVIFNDDLKII